MRNIHKKAIWVIVGIILCLTRLDYKIDISSADNSSKYLVLIQERNGSWTPYTNLIELSDNGNVMIRAKKLSKALGLTYKKKKNGAFDIKKSTKRYNSYTRGEKKIIYTNGAHVSKMTGANEAYTSKTSKYNLCHISTISTLVYYKFFHNLESHDYNGYKGVVCYSKYKDIPVDVPSSNNGTTKIPTPSQEPEPLVITIEGVEFPVRKDFLMVKSALSDWGGTGVLWNQLEIAVDHKILPSTNLIIGTDKIEFTHLTSGSDGITVKQVGKEYELAISVKLLGSVISDQNSSIVKAMITTISSTPSMVYQAIYESFTSDVSHGMNEDKYVVIGDSKIKVEIDDGKVIYHIKKA